MRSVYTFQSCCLRYDFFLVVFMKSNFEQLRHALVLPTMVKSEPLVEVAENFLEALRDFEWLQEAPRGSGMFFESQIRGSEMF